MKKIIILFFITFLFGIGFSQSNINNYTEYESTSYSFSLPNFLIIPNQKVTNEYRERIKSIALTNNMKFNDFDFLFSAKGENPDMLYYPIVSVTSLKTKENLFTDMVKNLGNDYIEKDMKKENIIETIKLGKLRVDSKKNMISTSMNSEVITGYAIYFFSENSVVIFTYNENKGDKCLECLVSYYLLISENFKFK